MEGDGNNSFHITGDRVPLSISTVIYKGVSQSPPTAQALPNQDTRPGKSFWSLFGIFDSTSKECQFVKDRLLKLYQKCTLPQPAWSQGTNNLLIQDYFVDLQLSDEKSKPTIINEIFDKVNGRSPLRILIEGQPGFGKTALATKIAHDWSSGKTYLKHFKLVFLLPLKELKQISIEEAIIKLTNRCDIPKNYNIIEIINDNIKDTLFILDGLDELSIEDRDVIMKTLYKQIYSETTVVVFSRKALVELTKDEYTQLFGNLNIQTKFYDKHIKILGIQSIINKRKFLKQHIPEQTDHIMDLLSSQLDLFDCPLFLTLLIVIIIEEKTIGKLSTKTELYKKLFNCIIKHNKAKSDDTLDSDTDLFNVTHSLNKTQEIIHKFGTMCAHKIINSDFQFECNDLTTCIYDYGFLINHSEATLFQSKSHYEALHLSILEFASAIALWMDLQLGESLPNRNLELSIKHFMIASGTSQVMPFLASLMEDNLDYLLSRMKSYQWWFSSCFDSTVMLFHDCTSTNINNSAHLKHFIPSYIYTAALYFDRQYQDSFRYLMNYGLKCGKIEIIRSNRLIKPFLLINEIANSLKIIIDYEDVSFTVISGIPCNLKQFLSYPPEYSSEGLKNCFDYVILSNVDSCTLQLNNNSLQQLLITIQEKQFNQIKFYYFTIDLTNKVQKQLAEVLLVNNQVKHIVLDNQHDHYIDFSGICFAAGQSTYLTSIEMSWLIVDLHVLTNKGTKSYDYIKLEKCTVIVWHYSTLKNSCQYLSVDSSFNNAETISLIQPRYLNWKSNQKLTAKKNVLCDIKNVQYLYLNDNELCSHFIQLSLDIPRESTNLQTLHIELQEDLDQTLLAKCVTFLTLKTFVIETHGIPITNLLRNIIKFWSLTIYKLARIDRIYNYSKTVEFEEITELVQGLKCNKWNRINLVFKKELFWNPIPYLIDLRDFNVTHYLYGSNAHDAEEYKLQYKRGEINHAFCVTPIRE